MARFPFRFDRFMKVVTPALFMGPAKSGLEIEDGKLRVRMGWAFDLEAPIDAIASAELQTNEPLLTRVTVGVHGWKHGWRVNGASTPIVRIRFRELQAGRTAFVPIKVDELAVNPEDPVTFLNAIGHPA